MIKKLYPLFFLGLFLSFGLHAQKADKMSIRKAGKGISTKAMVTGYDFTKTTAAYADLSGATSVNGSDIWDDPEYSIPIGFTFNLFGEDISSIQLGAGLGMLLSTTLDTNYNAKYYIAPFEADLIDRGEIDGVQSLSPISYVVNTTPEGRVFILEFKEAGFFEEIYVSTTNNDFVNVQLWLYENTNVIEFHYGSSSISDYQIAFEDETGPIIGLTDSSFTESSFINGTATNVTISDSVVYMDGVPADGDVYRFTPKNSSLEEYFMKVDIHLYPVPSKEVLNIDFSVQDVDGVDIKIVDITGKTMMRLNDAKQNNKMNIDQLTEGIYFVLVEKDGLTLRTRKIVKI